MSNFLLENTLFTNTVVATVDGTVSFIRLVSSLNNVEVYQNSVTGEFISRFPDYVKDEKLLPVRKVEKIKVIDEVIYYLTAEEIDKMKLGELTTQDFLNMARRTRDAINKTPQGFVPGNNQ